ncbi:hypothetical protein OpiT1DRAFT_00052 [Opitutaceae bacterium TAV1]|nr:hypothetical protein OpiT1DRAFT_00052 [Opitutaceae bacterium TAV1]
MSSQNNIPRKDEDFHLWQANFAIQINAGTPSRGTRLGIPTEKLTTLQDLQGEWSDGFLLASQPATRTSLTIEQKNAARDTYEAFLRGFIRQYITANDVATNDDRTALGLPIPKTTHTRIPAPTTHPVAEQHGSQPGLVELHFRDEEGTARGKPGLAHGAEIAYDVLDAVPGDPSDLVHSEIDTRSPFKKQFRADQRGLKFWYAMRWESPTGDKGPWSPLSYVIIP